MSVYRPKGSPFYHYDFRAGGVRFCGSTKRAGRREAEAVERERREEARRALRQSTAGALTLSAAADRFWLEVGQHHANADTTWTNLERIVDFLGGERPLADITDSNIARMVAWRRGQHVRGEPHRPRVSAATVNRSVVQLPQAIFARARRAWGASLPREPDWRRHRLKEPVERVRELAADEAERIETAVREDYEPFLAYARASGQRLEECLLRWSEVDWSARLIVRTGKQGGRIVVPITPAIRAILWPLRGHHPEWVFTYVAQRTVRRAGKAEKVKGRRYPITYNGAKTVWRRLRAAAGVADFRFHDFRHDLASKLLRETGNLKLVQQALNHRSITTTTRYAHVLVDDVAEGLERLERARERDRKSRKKSRRPVREAG